MADPMDLNASVGQRLVPPESPLLRLPLGLPPEEHFLLGALAGVAQMMDVAYGQLQVAAVETAWARVKDSDDEQAPVAAPALMLAAWGALDAI